MIYKDINEAAIDLGYKLLKSESIKSTNKTNTNYKNIIGGELIQQFFTLTNPAAVIGTYKNHKGYKWWGYGEILSEFLNLNPPIMYKYKPELFSQHYDLLDDGRMQYTYSNRFQEFNQFVNIYNKLKDNPNSKRAVIDIYTPYDTAPDRADVPCVIGETIIKSPEGDITIKDLVKLFKEKKIDKYPVFSANLKDKKVEIKWCLNAWKSGNKKIIEIKFDNDDVIQCTPEHKICVKKNNGNKYIWVETQHLKKGDRIISLHIMNKKKNVVYIKNLSDNNHKVVSVKKLNINKNVYDLEVEDNHNVFVNSGILIHNCTTMYHLLHRDGKLNMSVFMRSWDFFGGFKTYDFMLSSMILQGFSSWLNMKPGNLSFYANSLHYYNRDKESLEKLLDESHCDSAEMNLGVDNISIKQFYDELRLIKDVEEASYNQNFDFATQIHSKIQTPLFSEMSKVWINKNGKNKQFTIK